MNVECADDRLRWRRRGRDIVVSVPGLAAAARDPRSGRIVALSREGEGRLLLFDPDGRPAGALSPPPGYALSHLAEESGRLLVVGQGEAAVEGWHDWHFEIDAAAGRLTRAAPAY